MSGRGEEGEEGGRRRERKMREEGEREAWTIQVRLDCPKGYTGSGDDCVDINEVRKEGIERERERDRQR